MIPPTPTPIRAGLVSLVAVAGVALFGDGRPVRDIPAAVVATADRLSSGGYALWFAGTEHLRAADPATGPRPASPGLAALDPKVSGNLRLGEDPAALPAERRAQAEPHLARSFTDTNLLVATFQEGRFTDGGAVNCGYALSTDGGLTWRRDLIPHLVSTTGDGVYDRASDPVAGVDPEGRIYLNTLALTAGSGPTGFAGHVVVSRSDDGGATFTRPLVAVDLGNPDFFPDKNWMAVNAFPDSPTAGRVAVTFTRFDYSSPAAVITPIAVTHSDDHGVTWTTPRVISPPSCQGSQPVFLPDGSLVVLYWNFSGANGNQIELVDSPDGGTTWSSPRLVAAVTRHDDPVARDGSFLPAATADRHLGVIYATWQGWQNGPRIFFSRSRDRGVTWTTPRVVNDTPGNRSVFNPAIAVSPEGQHVTVHYCDKRHDDGSGRWVDSYLAESFDGGDTWQAGIRLTTTSSDLNRAPLTGAGRMLGDYQGIVPALNFGAPAVAIWIDTRDATPDPYVAAITRTQGSTYEAWRRLAFKPTDLFTPALTGPGADPDGDRLPNRFEYLIGFRPLLPDSNPVRAAANRAINAVELSVETLVTATDSGLLWRGSTDLHHWQPAAPEHLTGERGTRPEGEWQRVRFPTDAPLRVFEAGAE